MTNKIFIKVFVFLSLFLSVMGRIQKDTLIERPPTPEIKEEPLKKPISGLNIVSGENITVENITESSGVWSENQTTIPKERESVNGFWSESPDDEISAADDMSFATALLFSYLMLK